MLQSDNFILFLAVITCVVILGIVFIRRAMQHKKNMEIPVEEERISDISDSVPCYSLEEKNNIGKNFYLIRFICAIKLPFTKGKYVKIRQNHYELIKKITGTIGKDDVSIGRYIDNVLNVHFEEYKESITSLYNENTSNLFETDE